MTDPTEVPDGTLAYRWWTRGGEITGRNFPEHTRRVLAAWRANQAAGQHRAQVYCAAPRAKAETKVLEFSRLRRA